MSSPAKKNQEPVFDSREARLAWERERIAEADADIAAGRVIADEELDDWLADLVAGKPVRIP
jgi:predicted transcriptional regulator